MPARSALVRLSLRQSHHIFRRTSPRPQLANHRMDGLPDEDSTTRRHGRNQRERDGRQSDRVRAGSRCARCWQSRRRSGRLADVGSGLGRWHDLRADDDGPNSCKLSLLFNCWFYFFYSGVFPPALPLSVKKKVITNLLNAFRCLQALMAARLVNFGADGTRLVHGPLTLTGTEAWFMNSKVAARWQSRHHNDNIIIR